MVENLLKVIYVLDSLQQAEHLRMLNVYRLQSTKIGGPGDSAPLQPSFGGLRLLAFPKTKITFERKEISDIDEIQENTTEQLMMIGRTV